MGNLKMVDGDADSLLVVTVYTAEDMESAYKILDVLRSMAKELYTVEPSFGSITFHLSQSGLRVMAYETWSNRADYLHLYSSEKSEKYLVQLRKYALGVDPCVYEFEDRIMGTLG